jgi:signal transduction histidine kinase
MSATGGEVPAARRGTPLPAAASDEAADDPRVLVGSLVDGRYRLLDFAGQGGMGSVWLARRSDGRYEGQAAVKLLNLGALGHGGAERLRHEANALAKLSHPNITHLIDAGVTAGQPYLVLEYVEGEPIDVWCDAQGLGVEARVQLFLQVLRAVSHDLTTPLTAIRIHTASLERQTAGSPELSDAVRAISDETARLHRRIDNLLTIARLESGRFTPHPEPTPPADLFRTVRESLASVLATRPVTITLDDDCPDAYADPSLVLEILVNVVENAHRASGPGRPIELAAQYVGSHVRLEVRDRGPGVAADSDLARHGLGLEIARGLATACNGIFTLTNREGGGAIARVDLPVARVA